jgi:hypothetical protein
MSMLCVKILTSDYVTDFFLNRIHLMNSETHLSKQ